ncbi:hypothetical protein Tco_0201398 [Tanacetum coccineum]
MDGINIDDLTIEQYLRLTQENHASSMVKKVDDMTIVEYLEYEEAMKIQDYEGYQPNSVGVSTKHMGYLSLIHKSHSISSETKTDPHFQSPSSPTYTKITKSPAKYELTFKGTKHEQSNDGLGDWQAQEDALRNWEAQIDQLRRKDHEVSECRMVHIPKHDILQKNDIQIESMTCLSEESIPGSFTLPCSINVFNVNAIADLGASVNGELSKNRK